MIVRKLGKYGQSGITALDKADTNTRKGSEHHRDANTVIQEDQSFFLPNPSDIFGQDYVPGRFIGDMIDIYTAYLATVYDNVEILEENIQNISNQQNNYELTGQNVSIASQNVVLATGLGVERKLKSSDEEINKKIITFTEFQSLSRQEKEKLTNKNIIIAGFGGDSSAVVIESILATNPNAQITGVSPLDLLTIKHQFEPKSHRYSIFGEFLESKNLDFRQGKL